MGNVKWMGAALVGMAGVALVVAWALAPDEDAGDAPQNDSNGDMPSTATQPRVRDHTAPSPVVGEAALARKELAEDASATAALDDGPIAVEGLDAAEIERSIALLETIEIGGVPYVEAWRQMLELLKTHDGDRRVFVDLALELERTDRVKLAVQLLRALGSVVDDRLTLCLLESVDRLHDLETRRAAILALAHDRREIGPPPGARAGPRSGVHEADVRTLLIAKTRAWIASENAEDAQLADAAIGVLRYSVTYPDARNALIEAIDAPREGVGTTAVMALSHHVHGPEVRDALFRASTTAPALEDAARSQAASALVRLGRDEGLELVVTELETAEKPSIHMLFGLSGISSYQTSPALIRRARDVLLRALDAPDPEAQQYAATALIWNTDPRQPLAADADEILGRVIALIRDPERNATTRWRVLAQMGVRTATLELGFDAFVEVARDESAPRQVREEALDQIGNLACSESSQSATAEEVLRSFPETTQVEKLRYHARKVLERVADYRK